VKFRTVTTRCAALVIAFSLISFFAQARFPQPNAEYQARRAKLRAQLDGPLVLFAYTSREDSSEFAIFFQEPNFYYLTGDSEPDAAVVLLPESAQPGEAKGPREILYMPARDPRQEKWTGPKLGAENPDAPKVTGFDRVEEMSKLPEEVTKLLTGARPVIYTDVPAAGQPATNLEPLDFLKRTNSFLSFADVKPTIFSLRTYKDSGEVALIHKAVDASLAAHFAAFKAVKPEVTEREVSALMQYEWGKRGCERPAYAPIVGSGFSSTVLHYSDDDGTMKAGEVVVIDAAGEYSMYASDITRTLPINGHFTARQREIYDIVLGAQEAAAAAFKSGKSTMKRNDPESLYKVAFDYINTHGKDLHGQPLGQYFIHGLGHPVGLNVHDSTDLNAPLGPGQVFTIEPGIYIPEEKLGVRIEDDYYVDPDGKLIKLSAALPSKAEDVEKAMAGK